MSFPGGTMAGAAGGLRFSSTRGRIQGAPMQGVNYPSPFFDVAHTYLPVTVRHLFRWCRYYFLTNPLINATVFKLSQYPVTDIIVDHPSESASKRWEEYLQNHLRYRSFQAEVGLDYYTYGNAFVSIGYPLRKTLICRSCNHSAEAKRIRQYWIFTNFEYRLTCPKCGQIGDARVWDRYDVNPSGIRLIRWNPEDIEITYNDLTGDHTFYYTISATMKNDIIIGRKDMVENIPSIFIEAMRKQKGIVFNKENFFHFKRPSLAHQDRGWGIPLLLPVLKDTFYLQIMKKAQEAILLEHIVPLRVLFPQAGSGTSDPYTTINLADWRDHVAQEIAHWRYDNNYIPIMPLPLGNQTIGGDGKALLLGSEIQQWSDHILVGMGVPREFVFGGLSYAGTNLSMRMMENFFLDYIGRHRDLLKFVLTRIGAFLDWPQVGIRFKPFKMADDLQRKAYLAQLNQAGKVSDTTLLADADLSQSDENAIIIKESSMRIEAMKKQQLAVADIQGESQLIMAKWQVKAQQESQKAMGAPLAQGEPGGPEGMQQGGAAGGAEAGGQMPPDLQVAAPGGGSLEMQRPTAEQNPDFASAVQSPLNQGQSLQQGGQQAAGVDLTSMAMNQAKLIQMMDPALQQMALQNLQAQSPELADLVTQLLKTLQKGKTNGAAANGVDRRPLPEQRAPRRQTPSV